MDDPALLALARELGESLQARQRMLALAESCTGGLAAGYVTAIAGSSAWFDSGYVTYSNQAKMDLLKVSPATLSRFGAVSEATAQEMAVGAMAARASMAAAITGIAGPGGGTAEKPVGMVCFAWAEAGRVITDTRRFIGNRQEIRLQAVATAFQGLLDMLQR